MSGYANKVCLLAIVFIPVFTIPAVAQNVTPASDWSDMFKRSAGWYGADGIYSVPLDNDRTLLFFSDTMISDSTDGARKSMIHNSAAILEGHQPDKGKIHFYWDTTSTGRPHTIFLPNTPSTQAGDYYWLGAGFYNSSKKAAYVFAYKMRNTDPHNDWSFTLTKTNLIVIPAGSAPPFKNHRQIETPLSFQGPSDNDKGTYGAGILATDDYIYVYGIKGRSKGLILARVRPDGVEDFAQWRFWDGENWNKDMQRSSPIVEGVSDELSMSPLKDGKYILVYQAGGMSPTVAMRTSPTPWGPFGPETKLWECTEGQENKNYYTYNAKAHPALSGPDEILISYNVNSFDFWKEIQRNPYLYRPRFLKLRLAGFY